MASARRSSSCVFRTLVLAGCAVVAAPCVAQKEFRVHPSFEGDVAEAPLPPDFQVPGELVVGHMMFPDGRTGGQWRYGGTGWTDNYPKGDRALIEMLRRFTRTHVRAVEQPVNLEDGDDVHYGPGRPLAGSETSSGPSRTAPVRPARRATGAERGAA